VGGVGDPPPLHPREGLCGGRSLTKEGGPGRASQGWRLAGDDVRSKVRLSALRLPLESRPHRRRHRQPDSTDIVGPQCLLVQTSPLQSRPAQTLRLHPCLIRFSCQVFCRVPSHPTCQFSQSCDKQQSGHAGWCQMIRRLRTW
jgi:hypothetical protein